MQELADSLLERRTIDAGPTGLAGKRIEFPGLQATITDVLVRIQLLDGRTWTTIVRPSQPWIEIAAEPTGVRLLGTYVIHGIRHIAFGPDHLLFVFGLLLDRQEPLDAREDDYVLYGRAFDHACRRDLRLGGGPGRPVEAAIALSIFFLGPEIVRSWRGESSFTIRHPWVVAFVFGLLHGFGFSTALTSAGLPRAALPAALLGFNVGVEIGQLGFVLLVLGLERASAGVPDPLAPLGGGPARVRRGHARRLLDDPAYCDPSGLGGLRGPNRPRTCITPGSVEPRSSRERPGDARQSPKMEELINRRWIAPVLLSPSPHARPGTSFGRRQGARRDDSAVRRNRRGRHRLELGQGRPLVHGQDVPGEGHGLTVAEVGITQAEASGSVYNLKSLEDFDGIFAAAGAEGTAGKGAGFPGSGTPRAW